MDERQTKRIRKAAVDISLKQKLQNLPLLCVEAICKVTPTSRLIRLYSTAVPLPGASWNYGLEVALKRRQISISEDTSYGPDGDTLIDALFDASGAKVATIKHPEAFHLSPLCEFVDSATVPFRILPPFAVAELRLRFVILGPLLLPHLPNARKVELLYLGNFKKPYPLKTLDDKDFLLPTLKELLPQLESFAVKTKRHENRKMLDITLVELLSEMAVLKRLDVPPDTFDSLMRAAIAGSEALWRALSGLSSLRLRQARWDRTPRLDVPVVNFMSGCCTHLTRLSMMVQGELKPYLIALRAFANLTVLGLELYKVNTKGITFGEDEAVSSVLELRLVHTLAYLRPHVIGKAQRSTIHRISVGSIASLFPNVKVASLHYATLAAELCEKTVWPKLEELACFPEIYGRDLSLAQFLASSNLPSSVDLSPISDVDLARDSHTLTDIYRAVQSSLIKTLLLRGPLHRGALPRLQAYIDLNSQSAKITAWKDRDLGEQMSIIRPYEKVVAVPATEFSQLTDVRIVGTKEKGGDFTIRVVHQHTMKTNILWRVCDESAVKN